MCHSNIINRIHRSHLTGEVLMPLFLLCKWELQSNTLIIFRVYLIYIFLSTYLLSDQGIIYKSLSDHS